MGQRGSIAVFYMKFELGPVRWLSGRSKTLNLASFVDTISVILSTYLWWLIRLQLYPFVSFLIVMTLFQDHVGILFLVVTLGIANIPGGGREAGRGRDASTPWLLQLSSVCHSDFPCSFCTLKEEGDCLLICTCRRLALPHIQSTTKLKSFFACGGYLASRVFGDQANKEKLMRSERRIKVVVMV